MMQTVTRFSAGLRNFALRLCHHRVLSVALLALVLHGASFAHVQKAAVTRVLFNPNTHNIEVMHRFLVHDAEHAASLIFGERQGLLESAESRELFSSYVRNRFAIQATDVDGKSSELLLDYVGCEIDGQFLWVYQEYPDTTEIKALSVVNSALRDIWPDQENLVNIEKSGQIYTLNFSGSDDMLSVEL